MLDNAAEVDILGKDASGTWYQIAFPAGPDSTGWLVATYIRLEGKPEVPIIGGGGEETSTGLVIEKLNVRAGPSGNADSLGILNASDVLTLTGKNSAGTWLQVDYPSGPGGRGWVSAGYVRTQNVESLPIISEDGQPVGTGTPEPLPNLPTSTLAAALPDSDSAQVPAAAVSFSPTGTRQFTLTGQVSSPRGDTEDWVAFIPYGQPGTQAMVSLQIECNGNGQLHSELWLNNQLLPEQPTIPCNSPAISLPLTAGQTHSLRLYTQTIDSELQFVGYTVHIWNSP